MIKKKKIEDEKKRFVRGLLTHLERERRGAARMSVISEVNLVRTLHRGRENALHDIACYVRAITKPQKIKK